MAANATIYKASLNIANMDTHYYAEHDLTIAKHPSENDLRLMVRIIAFVLNANENLVFCKGIDSDNEPDLWEKKLDGEIKLWLDLGQPDEKRIRKACGRADEVIIYTYQEGAASSWFAQVGNKLKRFKNLRVINLKIKGDIDALALRSMKLQCNITDNELSLLLNELSVEVTQEIWKD
ncbi:MAG: hypothetical protein COA44_08345 [Arcobacter sp.]|nr:MAG: hypothetical protein COA44_08345 [Arcobacter sp.]